MYVNDSNTAMLPLLSFSPCCIRRRRREARFVREQTQAQK